MLIWNRSTRWKILTFRYTGVVILTGAVTLYLLVGVWILVAIKANVWNQLLNIICAVGILIVVFGSIYSFAVLICTISKSGIIGTISSGLFYTLTLFKKEELLLTSNLENNNLLKSKPVQAVHDAVLSFFPNARDLEALAQSFINDNSSTYTSWNPFFYALAFSFVSLVISILIINRRDFPNYAADN